MQGICSYAAEDRLFGLYGVPAQHIILITGRTYYIPNLEYVYVLRTSSRTSRRVDGHKLFPSR